MGAFLVSAQAAGLPVADMEFLKGMTHDVLAASTVAPGSNGGGKWPITNSFGFALITPGKDTYTAFWVRDFSMALDTGLVSSKAIQEHLRLICRIQNGATNLELANGLHVPPWSIPDHINYDGKPVWYPGTYSSGNDQGAGACGRVPPIDDHYELVHIAWVLWNQTKDTAFLQEEVNGMKVYDRLVKAFDSPTVDPKTGLTQTTEADRAVGFGFCDAEVHTGKLLFASLLRYRAAGELADLAAALGRKSGVPEYSAIQKQIRENVATVFADPKSAWLLASTERSAQPDVWGTLYALRLGVMDGAAAPAAREAVVKAVKERTIVFEGAVRHVPTDRDFSKTTAWEKSLSPSGTYQNGGYWHTASGWLIEVLWQEDQELALQVFGDMIKHLREQDFRKGPGHGAPWEVFGPNKEALRNPVYLASVALPYSILKDLK